VKQLGPLTMLSLTHRQHVLHGLLVSRLYCHHERRLPLLRLVVHRRGLPRQWLASAVAAVLVQHLHHLNEVGVEGEGVEDWGTHSQHLHHLNEVGVEGEGVEDWGTHSQHLHHLNEVGVEGEGVEGESVEREAECGW
jgi:hypothetical protein